jgi:hypothetical protein
MDPVKALMSKLFPTTPASKKANDAIVPERVMTSPVKKAKKATSKFAQVLTGKPSPKKGETKRKLHNRNKKSQACARKAHNGKKHG